MVKSLFKKTRFGNSKESFSGFTLIEVLLYISLVSIIGLSLVSFFGAIVQSQNRNRAVSEVDQSGLQVTEYLTYLIRNATAVNSPNTAGTSATSLSFNTLTPANNPTVISLNSGAIRIQEGASSPLNLTSNIITASNLSFKNLTSAGARPVIKFQFRLTYINPSNQSDLNYFRDFYGTAVLRQ